jgi:hypothetical protein
VTVASQRNEVRQNSPSWELKSESTRDSAERAAKKSAHKRTQAAEGTGKVHKSKVKGRGEEKRSEFSTKQSANLECGDDPGRQSGELVLVETELLKTAHQLQHGRELLEAVVREVQHLQVFHLRERRRKMREIVVVEVQLLQVGEHDSKRFREQRKRVLAHIQHGEMSVLTEA